MPVTRSYGGYPSPTYTSSYYPSSSAGYYSSSYRSYGGSGLGRSTTPAPGPAGQAAVDDVLSGPATYKYLSRTADYYSGVTPGERRSYGLAPSVSRKTINTEDIGVEKEDKKVEREHAIPGEIKRDTAATNVARGKQVIRLVTMKQKKNPFEMVGAREGEELTMGQKLAMKHMLVDPRSRLKSPSPPPTVNRRSIASNVISEDSSEENSSDWTWETCSSSEEGPDVKYFPSAESSCKKKVPSDNLAHSKAVLANLSGSRQSLDRWTRAMFSNEKKKSPSIVSKKSSSNSGTNSQSNKAPPYEPHSETKDIKPTAAAAPTPAPTPAAPPAVPESRKVAFQVQRELPVSISTAYSLRPPKPGSSSGSEAGTSSAAPEPIKFAKPYIGREYDSSDEEEVGVNRGWRKGQPPRSDVVVKLASDKLKVKAKADSKTSAKPDHSKLTNKILTSAKELYTALKPKRQEENHKPVVVSLVNATVTAKDPPTPMPLMHEEAPSLSHPLLPQAVPSWEAMFPSKIEKVLVAPPQTKISDAQIVAGKVAFPQTSAKTLSPGISTDSGGEDAVTASPSPSPSAETRPAAAAYCLISSESEAETEPLAVVQGKIQIEFQPQSRRSSQATTATTVYTRTTDGTEEAGSEDAGEYDLDYLEDVGSKVSTESGEILERNGGDADTEKTSVNKSEFGSFAATDGAEERTSSDLSRTAAAPVSVASPTATCNEGTEDDVPCEQTRPGPSRLADGAKDADRGESLRPPADAQLAKIHAESVPCARSERNPEVKVSSAIAVPEKDTQTQPAAAAAEAGAVGSPAVLDFVLPVSATATVAAAAPAAQSDFISVEVKKRQTKAAAVDVVADGGGKQKKKMKKRLDKVEAEVDVGRQGKRVDESKVKGPTAATVAARDVSSVASSASSARSSLKSTGSSVKEEAIIAPQLDRLPSEWLEWKNSPGTERKNEGPKEKPKYWNNVPKPCDPTTNPGLTMAAMRTEAKEHQKKVKEQQEELLRTSTSEPEEPWYMDEPDDLKETLRNYQHRPSDHHKNESDKRTPEENMDVIRLYGGVQFPGGPLEDTPRRWLRKPSTVKKRRKLNNNREQDTAVDGGSSEGQLPT